MSWKHLKCDNWWISSKFYSWYSIRIVYEEIFKFISVCCNNENLLPENKILIFACSRNVPGRRQWITKCWRAFTIFEFFALPMSPKISQQRTISNDKFRNIIACNYSHEITHSTAHTIVWIVDLTYKLSPIKVLMTLHLSRSSSTWGASLCICVE